MIVQMDLEMYNIVSDTVKVCILVVFYCSFEVGQVFCTVPAFDFFFKLC